MAPRKQVTLVDVYRARGFQLTREQARKLVALLRLTEERPAPAGDQPARRPAA
jgi:hypothetical protein